jgi:myo-inositol-1(or 4)-monophosphatase
MRDLDQLLEGTERVVASACEALLAMQGSTLRTERKDLNDVVTEADLAAERILIDGLRALTPEAAILSEEAGASGPTEAPRWIIDPLDGTVNYAAGLPWFSVTVAYQHRGVTLLGFTRAPRAGLVARYVHGTVATVDGVQARVSQTTALADAVVSVVLTSHFSAEDVRRTAALIARLGELARGVRVIVSGALEMSLVASGRLDAFVSLKADVVSHAAAMPLVRAAGGRTTTFDGREASDDDPERIVSNGLLHDELAGCLREALR